MKKSKRQARMGGMKGYAMGGFVGQNKAFSGVDPLKPTKETVTRFSPGSTAGVTAPRAAATLGTGASPMQGAAGSPLNIALPPAVEQFGPEANSLYATGLPKAAEAGLPASAKVMTQYVWRDGSVHDGPEAAAPAPDGTKPLPVVGGQPVGNPPPPPPANTGAPPPPPAVPYGQRQAAPTTTNLMANSGYLPDARVAAILNSRIGDPAANAALWDLAVGGPGAPGAATTGQPPPPPPVTSGGPLTLGPSAAASSNPLARGGPLTRRVYNKGGRVRKNGLPLAEGGRVTNRDRQIEEAVEGKKVEAKEKEVAKESKVDLSDYDPEFLKKHGMNPDGTKIKKGGLRGLLGLKVGGKVSARNGVVYDRNTGEVTIDGKPVDMSRQAGVGSRRDQRMYGTSGFLPSGANEFVDDGTGQTFETYAQNHPQYYDAYQATTYDGDAGPTTRTSYRLKPEVTERLRGRVHVPQAGTGGYLEVSDPSRVEWDDEFGLLTTPDNISAPDSFRGGFTGAMSNYVIPAVTMAAIGGGLGSMTGLTGAMPWEFGGVDAAAGAGLTDAGLLNAADYIVPAADTTLGAVPELAGFEGLGELGFNLPEIPGFEELGVNSAMEGVNQQVASEFAQNLASQAASTPGGWERLMQWATANPGTAARIGMSVAALARGRPGGSSAQAYSPGAGGTYTPGGSGAPSGTTTQTGSGIGDPINALSGLSAEEIARYRQFAPLEDQLIDEASNAGSAEMQEERASLAADDVANQYGRQRGIVRRSLQSGAVNPDSAQGQALMGRLGNDEAASRAASMNDARRSERDLGFTRRAALMGLAGQHRDAGTAIARDTRNFDDSRDRFDRTFTEGTRRWDQGHDLDVWRANNNQNQTNRQNDRQDTQDIGSGILTGLDIWNNGGSDLWDTVSGWFADGGKARARGMKPYMHGGEVDGPGDGTVDTVPAMLADGEMVVNAEGTALLDKMAPGFLDKVNKKGLAIRKMRDGGRAASRGLKGC